MTVFRRSLRLLSISGCITMLLVLNSSKAGAQAHNGLRSPAPSGSVLSRAEDVPGQKKPQGGGNASRIGTHAQRTPVRPASYGFAGSTPGRYVPKHERQVAMPMASHQVIQGPTVYEEVGAGLHMEGMPIDAASCGSGCGDCGACGPCLDGCLIPCPELSLKNFEFFGGVHGFKNMTNRGQDGSFGFHEGLNWASSVPCFPCTPLSWQLGLMGTHSNFSGADFTDESRNQLFLTGGFFRRVDWGLQGGIVVDYLRDEWDYSLDLMQLRAEMSWVFACRHELGVWAAVNLQNQTPGVEDAPDYHAFFEDRTLTTTDIYAFFYRRQFDECRGTEARVFAGFTGQSDGIIGGDMWVPISNNWALQTDWTYLFPEQSTSAAGNVHEAWNVAVNLVWYPGSTARGYNRPLFNVANNGSMIINAD